MQVKLFVAVHLLVVLAIVTAYDVFPPFTVLKIPLDGLLDTVSKFCSGKPAKLAVDLGGIDSITHIVTCAVLYVGNKVLALAKLLENDLNDVDILHFVVTADVIYLADRTLVNDKIDRAAVILYVEPVANVNTFTVNRERLVVKRVCDHKGDELFGEVVGSIVVRAAGNGDGKTEGAVISLNKKVCTCL